MSRELLFKTIHGSHLYGLAHEDSDTDYYTVWTTERRARARWAKQRITSDADVFSVDLPTWLAMCDKGVPQALEALFSTEPEVDHIPDLRAAWRPTTRVLPTYLRTMRHFIATGSTKRRRHAVRLALNVADLQANGRFDPRLTPAQAATVVTLEAVAPGEGLMHVCETVAFGRWRVPVAEETPVESN